MPLNASALDGKRYLYLLFILIFTFIAYSPALKNGFITKWDDKDYITENNHLGLSKANIEHSFFKGEDHGMYLPLTSLSFSINNYFSGLNPLPYHLTNILLHLTIILLVFWLMQLLFNSFEIAIVTAALFAFHAMQVESVAFAAGRRDLLYTLFFILSCSCYLKYLDTSKWKFYVMSLSIFILSLFSKGQAISLPVTLLILDHLRGRKLFSKQSIVEKVPFFILSLIFATIAFQVKSGTVYQVTDKGLPLSLQLILACYGLIVYIIKLLIPFNLSIIYPYPLNVDNSLPSIYFVFPILVLALVILVLYFFKKGYKEVALGIVFFVVNIFMVLQIAPNSYGIINEHYVYLPSIGIFFIIGYYYKKLTDKYSSSRYLITCVMMAYLIFIGGYTFSRCQDWKDSITLYSDVIKKYPEDKLSYNNRGNAFYDLKNYKEALKDFSMAIKLGGDNAAGYNNRASIYFDQKRYQDAINDYEVAIKLKPNYTAAYYNLGNAYNGANKYEEAIKAYDMAIKLNPNYVVAYYNRGVSYSNLHRFVESINDYDIAIRLKPDYAEAYYNRGNDLFELKKYEDAISNYNLNLKYQPSNVDAYINIGSVYMDLKKYEDAVKEYDLAENAKPDYAKAYYNKGNAFYNLSKFEQAIEEFNVAIKLNPNYALAYINRGMNYSKLNKISEANKDWEKASKLNPEFKPMIREQMKQLVKK